MIRFRLISIALLATALLTGCNQKELCYDHWDHAKRVNYAVDVDWQLDWEYTYPGGPDWQTTWDETLFGMTYNSLRPERPEGIRTFVYNPDGSYIEGNMAADGGKLYMSEGEHSILFYNNDTEYIIFSGLIASETAKATTSGVSRATFNSFNSPVEVPGAENTVNPPDPLFGHYIEEFNAEAAPTESRLHITMKPLVFRYLIRYHFSHGFEYVGIARGALLGMAYEVYLTDGHTTDATATILYDCTLKDGYVEAVVNSFGAPDYPNSEYSRANRPYGLNLEVRLRNGRILSYDFDISAQMAMQPRGGVIDVYGVDVPDSEGSIGGGGFDVSVEGWGDVIDVPIILGNN